MTRLFYILKIKILNNYVEKRYNYYPEYNATNMRIVHLENRAVAHNHKTPNRKEISLFILVFDID